MVAKNQSREETYAVSVPVQRSVEQNYTVQVPYTETREATPPCAA